MQSNSNTVEQRQEWISLLGSADPVWLEKQNTCLNLDLEPVFIVKPETGMIMMQARQDGSGPRFNLGEVTVSRCILKLGTTMGYSMVMGSNLRHAQLAALFDALLQKPEQGLNLQNNLVPKLRQIRDQKRREYKEDIETSKVEFFTLKRGE